MIGPNEDFTGGIIGNNLIENSDPVQATQIFRAIRDLVEEIDPNIATIGVVVAEVLSSTLGPLKDDQTARFIGSLLTLTYQTLREKQRRVREEEEKEKQENDYEEDDYDKEDYDDEE